MATPAVGGGERPHPERPAHLPVGALVHRPVRAYPPPLPAADLTVAAPPTVGWSASWAAGWLQYVVPLLGCGGSVAFLLAVPGPGRRGWSC